VHKPPTILVLFAHLAIQESRINRVMVEAIRDLEHVTVHDLLETYPDFFIDVGAEQRRLLATDLIVFQHPIYWYSAPGIFKHWQDVVLVRGFAYGEGTQALRGKDFMLAVSTGAPVEAYRPGGAHHYSLTELLRPSEQMARFCGMRYLPPLVLQGGHGLSSEIIREHALRYRQRLLDYRPVASPNAD
jgi:putative NADPH-quinone reductase